MQVKIWFESNWTNNLYDMGGELIEITTKDVRYVSSQTGENCWIDITTDDFRKLEIFPS